MRTAKLILLSLLLSAMVAAAAPVARGHERLLEAIKQVESRGNPNAVGDNGRAIGPFQIWKSYWQDAVEHDKNIGGRYEDCKNEDYARRIVLAYWDRYAPADATDEQLARLHNGGPKGHKLKATLKYWAKVKKELNK